MTDPLITCRELTDTIDGYLAGDFSTEQRAAFERHLAVCPECQDYLESYKTTVRLEQSAFEHPDDPAPASLPAGIIKAILALRSID